jgi:hypothetical protein
MAFPRSFISTSRKVLIATGALTFGGALALAGIEVGMRTIGYGSVSTLAYGRDHYNPDLPEIGYAGRPNIRGIQTREGVSEVDFNSHGFNDVEHDRARAPGVFRIAVIGNSFSMAVQVARADGFVSRLGDELAQCPALAGRKIETINLGVDGYTIDQQFLMLRDYGLSLSPDFVLLQTISFLLASDLDPSISSSPRLEMLESGSLVVDRSYLEKPEFRLHASGTAALVQRLSDQSRLLQYMLEYRRMSGKQAANVDSAPADPQVLERYRQGRDLVFDQFANLLRARKIPWAVTIVPTADAASYLPFQSDPVRSEWLNLAAKAGVPVFDVENDARAEVRATGKHLHGFGSAMPAGPAMVTSHLNRFGHAFFARALGTRLCQFLGGVRPTNAG